MPYFKKISIPLPSPLVSLIYLVPFPTCQEIAVKLNTKTFETLQSSEFPLTFQGYGSFHKLYQLSKHD